MLYLINKLNLILTIVLLINSYELKAQDGMGSIDKLQGVWHFQDEGYDNYMIIKGNRSIALSSFDNGKTVSIYGSPFSYFGFWNQNQHGDIEPMHINQLEASANAILFYDFLGKNYDSTGRLFMASRSCILTVNEDEGGNTPSVLRFYFKGNPDLYKKVDTIPPAYIQALRKNKENFKKYENFLKTENREITKSKAYIYSSPNSITKMYLIKGDKIEINDRQDSWLKFKYFGKKTIEGWIKKSDVE